jgi:hypothetical protein
MGDYDRYLDDAKGVNKIKNTVEYVQSYSPSPPVMIGIMLFVVFAFMCILWAVFIFIPSTLMPTQDSDQKQVVTMIATGTWYKNEAIPQSLILQSVEEPTSHSMKYHYTVQDKHFQVHDIIVLIDYRTFEGMWLDGEQIS